MRKAKIFMFSLLVSMVALTGCGKKNNLSPEDTIKKAISNMQSAENYKMTANFNITTKFGNSSIAMSADLDGIVDVKNKINKYNIKAGALGIESETEQYIKTDGDEVITYEKDADGNWTKQVSSDATSGDMTNNLPAILNSGNNIKELKADKNNYYYEITIGADAMKDMFSLMDDTDLDDLDNFDGKFIINVGINKKSYNYASISMDMTDLLNSVSSDAEYTKVELVINFSDYNKAGQVEIPAEVIENAKEESDIDFSTYGFDEDDYEEVLVCEGQDSDDTASLNATIYIGFNDGLSETSYAELQYDFNNEDDATEFYNEASEGEYDGVFKYNNTVSLTYTEDIDASEQTSYESWKANLEGEGFVCE